MSNEGQEKTFTQADLDALKAEHAKAISDLNGRHKEELDRKVDAAVKKVQAEAEEKARVANMSELEKAQKLADDYKIKFEAEADKNALTVQKDETRAYMQELGLDSSCLDYVFIPKDLDGTKAKAKAFKEYIDKVKKETFETNVKSKVPNAGNQGNTQMASWRKAAGLAEK